MTDLEKVIRCRERLCIRAKECEPKVVAFLREMIAIPGESSREKQVIGRIEREMREVGFDEIRIDGMGNILGRIGSGNRVIMMDSHTDTVGIGDPKEWKWDPYQGKVDNGYVYGRGACDQRAGMACMVYAAKLIKELDLLGDYTLWIVGSVQEEDCDGLSWIYILREDGIRPELVLITEPSSLRVYRGHRGRIEIEVHVRGRSCHASAPERGDNPIYKMNALVHEIEHLNSQLKYDPFLGKATIAVTDIRSLSPSLCAVPSSCTIHLDRRLIAGETKESAIAEIRTLPSALDAEIEVLEYKQASYTGLVYPMEKYYPTWVLEEDHPAVRAAVHTFEQINGIAPVVDKWTFSTNGVGSMGICGVPTMGFGPGDEVDAHSVCERVSIQHLVKAVQLYAAFPLIYVNAVERSDSARESAARALA
ncbi:MAG TPA: YgeY family selenium metabolism-linked hydrolase [Terriglobales bacterium]|nr:YgeY family selenium metabolism-linked hydrolase [Terriglobales bacterium]